MTLVIAEAGVNHNGDIDNALKLAEVANTSGADIIKFQTFSASKLVTGSAKKADYQISNTNSNESQLEMLKNLQLSHHAHYELKKYTDVHGIEFLSTAFDIDSLNFLVNEVGMNRLKIPSGEMNNAPLVLEHSRTNHDLILSTGMSSMSEIETTLGVIAFGFISELTHKPCIQGFKEAYLSKEGKEILSKKVTLLHCTTEYPAPLSEINLRAMNSMSKEFDLPIGYSDHSEGIEVSLAAVARGATVIEKHFTLDKNQVGPDHKASLEPNELKDMISGVRKIDLALGSYIKKPTSSELKNKLIARKSIYSSKSLKKGHVIKESDIDILRPGNGIEPIYFWEIIGKKIEKDTDKGEEINVKF